MPRCSLGGGGADRCLVGLLIRVPVLALIDVAGVELPVLVGALKPLAPALVLLLRGDEQRALHDDSAGSRDLRPKRVDVRRALLPRLAAAKAADADDPPCVVV